MKNFPIIAGRVTAIVVGVACILLPVIFLEKRKSLLEEIWPPDAGWIGAMVIGLMAGNCVRAFLSRDEDEE